MFTRRWRNPSWYDFGLLHAVKRNFPSLGRPDLLCIADFVGSLHAHLSVEIEQGHDVVLNLIRKATSMALQDLTHLKSRMCNVTVDRSLL